MDPQLPPSESVQNISDTKQLVTTVPVLKPRRQSWIMVCVCFLCAMTLIGILGYLLGQENYFHTLNRDAIPTTSIVSGTTLSPAVPGVSTLSMKTYISKRYGFSFRYASNLIPKDINVTGNKNSGEVNFISTDTKIDPHGGWAVSGIQLGVFVSDFALPDPKFTTYDNSLLPAKMHNNKIATIAGYESHGGDGTPFTVAISTSFLPKDYINIPASIQFVCFSPADDSCKSLLPQMIATFQMN